MEFNEVDYSSTVGAYRIVETTDIDSRTGPDNKECNDLQDRSEGTERQK